MENFIDCTVKPSCFSGGLCGAHHNDLAIPATEKKKALKTRLKTSISP
jgi:hypothetical protein